MQSGDAARNQAIDANYGSAVSRLNPQFAHADEQLRSRLAAQGIDPNTEAGRAANDQLDRGRNDAYGQALNSAISSGTQAGSAVFGQNLAAHQQNIADALRRREQPLQDMQSLSGLSNNAPGFNTAGAAGAAPIFQAGQAQDQFNLDNSKAQNDMWGSIASSLGGLLKAPFSFI